MPPTISQNQGALRSMLCIVSLRLNLILLAFSIMHHAVLAKMQLGYQIMQIHAYVKSHLAQVVLWQHAVHSAAQDLPRRLLMLYPHRPLLQTAWVPA